MRPGGLVLNKWKDKFQQFMQGRNGVDDLGMFLIIASVALLLISWPISSLPLSLISYACLIYSYFRVFSRNLNARMEENRKFLAEREHLRFKIQTWKLHRSMRKTYKYFTCKKCGQSLRVPRGKGKIEITCPKCGEKTVKKT